MPDTDHRERSDLRLITYLSPGLPRGLFEIVAAQVGEKLGIETNLLVEPNFSGPPKGSDDPFTSGEADVGFMCAPPFLWLREREYPLVELAGAAPVFRDARTKGQPVYFSEVVVDARRGIESVSEIRRWAYNDPCSMSGFYGLLENVGEAVGEARGMVCSGSHPASIKKILAGEVDAAAVDSNVLRTMFERDPKLRRLLRVVETWGPFPIQPVAVRSDLPPETKADILAALLSIGSDKASEFHLEGFVPVGYEHYEEERAAIRECEKRAATLERSRERKAEITEARSRPD